MFIVGFSVVLRKYVEEVCGNEMLWSDVRRAVRVHADRAVSQPSVHSVQDSHGPLPGRSSELSSAVQDSARGC